MVKFCDVTKRHRRKNLPKLGVARANFKNTLEERPSDKSCPTSLFYPQGEAFFQWCQTLFFIRKFPYKILVKHGGGFCWHNFFDHFVRDFLVEVRECETWSFRICGNVLCKDFNFTVKNHQNILSILKVKF